MSTGRLVVALILILIGLAFLTGNLGLFDWDYLADISRLWPLLLIILGIALFFGRRRRALSVILILLVIALGAALAFTTVERGQAGVREASFVGPAVEGIDSARLLLRVGATNLTVTGGGRRGIVEADYRARGDVEISDTGPGGDYEVEFAQQRRNFWFVPFLRGDDRQFFDISLATGVPWELDLDLGAADADIDLEEVTLRSLDIKAGASSLNLTVGPDVENGATIVVEGGAASFDLSLSRELTITIMTDTGLSSVDLDDDFQDQGDDIYVYDGGGPELNVELRAGVSSLNVELR